MGIRQRKGGRGRSKTARAGMAPVEIVSSLGDIHGCIHGRHSRMYPWATFTNVIHPLFSRSINHSMSYFKFICFVTKCFVSRIICFVTNLYRYLCLVFSYLNDWVRPSAHIKSEGAHKKTTEDRQANCDLRCYSLSARTMCVN
jgi:hypothetical protein